MILIIGGSYQGKFSYTLEHFHKCEKNFIDGRTCSFKDIFSCEGINQFHEYIKRMLIDARDMENFAERLVKQNPNIIIISNEIGYGVVPIDTFERRYRELTGRICGKLAENALEVHRVLCGIGTVIKCERKALPHSLI